MSTNIPADSYWELSKLDQPYISLISNRYLYKWIFPVAQNAMPRSCKVCKKRLYKNMLICSVRKLKNIRGLSVETKIRENHVNHIHLC